MTCRNPPALEDVFRTLDRWRHLPAYRLEPNLAPFFGLFLRDILHRCMETETHPIIIPEFPLHKGVLSKKDCTEADEGNALEEGKDNNLSVNVDYAVFSQSLEVVYLVELKTDSASIRNKQIEYLKKAECTDFKNFLQGIDKICRTTRHIQKYIHLLYNLKSIGFVDFPGSEIEVSYEKIFPEFMSDMKGLIQCNPAIEKSPKIKIIFITPTGHTESIKKAGFNEIGFDRVADIVWKRGGIGREFAYYLRKWIEPAGAADPRRFRAVP